MPQFTYNELKEMLHNELRKGTKRYLSASTKRGYSKIAGEQIPNKNDVSRATNQNCRHIAGIAKELYQDQPGLLAEEEDVEMVKPK